MANNQKIGSGNRYQAPILGFKGDKFNSKVHQFYEIPQELADILFNEFSRKPAYLRLMLVLCGTKPGFALSEKWIIDRTGLTHSTYNTIRGDLVEKGWLIVEDKRVVVNFDKIYRRIESVPQNYGVLSEYVKKDCGIESIPQNCSIESIRQNELGYSVNTSKQVLGYSQDILWGIESIPIIYNKIDNIETDNSVSFKPSGLKETYEETGIAYKDYCAIKKDSYEVMGEDEEWVYVKQKSPDKCIKFRKESLK